MKVLSTTIEARQGRILAIFFRQNEIDDRGGKRAVEQQHLPIDAFGSDQIHRDDWRRRSRRISAAARPQERGPTGAIRLDTADNPG